MNCIHCIYSEQALRLHPVRHYLVCKNEASNSYGEEVMKACDCFAKIGSDLRDAYMKTDTRIEAVDGN